MLQLRVVTPSDLTEAVLGALREEPGVATLAVQAGASLRPVGDVITCELTDERAHPVLGTLRRLGVEANGAISLAPLDLMVSAAGREAERVAPGQGADSLLWARIEDDARETAELSATYLVLMVIASVIATVAIAVDSAVLVIGAMIVSPEYGPLSGLAIGVYRKRPFTRHAAVTLAVGLAVVVAAAALTTLVAEAVGETEDAFSPDTRFFTAFVTEPNGWSVVVALAAGVAGMISLGQGRSTTLLGVLVSVTTIPAAAAMGVDIIGGPTDDFWRAALQLVINLVCVAMAGVATLAVHDRWWVRAERRWLPRRR